MGYSSSVFETRRSASMWESPCDVSVPSRFSGLAIHHGLAFLQGPFRNSGVAFINGFPYLSVGSSTLPLDVSRRALELNTHFHKPLSSRFLRSASRHSTSGFHPSPKQDSGYPTPFTACHTAKWDTRARFSRPADPHRCGKAPATYQYPAGFLVLPSTTALPSYKARFEIRG